MSVYCPEDGRPPRLLRFIPMSPEIPPDLIAVASRDANLVIIVKETFDTLTPSQQERVRRHPIGALTTADLAPAPKSVQSVSFSFHRPHDDDDDDVVVSNHKPTRRNNKFRSFLRK